MDNEAKTTGATAKAEPAEKEKQIDREHLAQEIGQVILKFLEAAGSQKLESIITEMTTMKANQAALVARVKTLEQRIKFNR